MEEEAKDSRSREIDRIWKAMETEDKEEKARLILQLMEAAEIRGSRGKKKKRGGKKGKKKKGAILTIGRRRNKHLATLNLHFETLVA